MGISTGGETICILGAGVCSCSGNDDAAILRAFGVCGDATTKVRVTFVGTRSGDGGATVTDTGKMGGAAITAEEGIAGVRATSGDSDTGSTLTFSVFSAVHNTVTGIGAGTLNSDAGLPFADGMSERSAADDGITLVGALPDDGDTGITLTFGVFVAVDAGGAGIGTGPGLREACAGT